jgi:hypothetical protein
MSALTVDINGRRLRRARTSHLRGSQYLTREHRDEMLRQKPGDRFDVLRRCVRKQNPDPLGHRPKIFVIIEEYNNDLRLKFRIEMIDHDCPRFVGRRLSP